MLGGFLKGMYVLCYRVSAVRGNQWPLVSWKPKRSQREAKSIWCEGLRGGGTEAVGAGFGERDSGSQPAEKGGHEGEKRFWWYLEREGGSSCSRMEEQACCQIEGKGPGGRWLRGQQAEGTKDALRLLRKSGGGVGCSGLGE